MHQFLEETWTEVKGQSASELLLNTWGGTGDCLNIKMPSYQYRDSHVKDKTVSPTVLSLTWESPYLRKTVFILRRAPGGWNPSLWKTMARLTYIANVMIIDALMMQGAKASAAMVLI